MEENSQATHSSLNQISTASFLSQFGLEISSTEDAEIDAVALDHSYAKLWSVHPDACNARPTRMLFMLKETHPSSLDILNRFVDSAIDVVNCSPVSAVAFDINKARCVMMECERHAAHARPDSHEDWEDKISKTGWTMQQTRTFSRVMKALQSDRLARLAVESVPNEPIIRRQIVDKTAKRLRHALAYVGWDTKLVQWLHHLILDNVSLHLLACYLDALQALKSQVPLLVEKMLSGSVSKYPALSAESLGPVLKQPWDPVSSAILQQKPKRLPNSPLLLLAPCGSATSAGKRLKFWQTQLSSMGKLIITSISGGGGNTIGLHLEQMIGALRTKVLEQKSHYPDKPIVLFGWDIEALVCCHVSLVEDVSAVICLGFPCTSTLGPRGDCEDALLNSATAVFFVVGQNANNCSVSQLQELREQMQSETGMLVVGGADEQLRLSYRHKREQGVTQAIVDHLIIHEISQFLGSILALKSGPQDPIPTEVNSGEIRKKRKRKISTELTNQNASASLISGSNRMKQKHSEMEPR